MGLGFVDACGRAPAHVSGTGLSLSRFQSPSPPVLSSPIAAMASRSLPAALFVLDREAVILSRAWCAFELYAAAAEGDGAVDFGGHLADRFREDDVLFSGVELCKTSSTYDKDSTCKPCFFAARCSCHPLASQLTLGNPSS